MNYRPKVHFSAKKNWINDPNGMVYIDGQYHLFFQHYPHAMNWGPMHWGHAVSRDLLHWEELPIALYPDELGLIFSGSCVFDKENISGLGSVDIPMLGVKGKAPLIAMYTSHLVTFENGERKSLEQQSIAYSTDLVHFEKYYGNPVITNPGKKDFRDPKMFYNPVRDCYSVVIAGGSCVDFYSSKDLKNWEKTGSFEAGVHGAGGICECPDCFMMTAEDGTEKWILVVSIILPADKIGKNGDVYDRMTHVTQYYVGDFDGDTFTDTELADKPLLLDYGTDNYAPVSFQNLDERVMMGWGTNWDYARKVPSEGFLGQMTLARRMRLVKTEEGYRLASSFEGLEPLRSSSWNVSAGTSRLRQESFGIRAVLSKDGDIVISNSDGERIVVTLTEKEIIVDRSEAGRSDFSEHYAKESYSVSRAPRKTDSREVEILFDGCVLEVMADHGMAPFCVVVYPNKPYDLLSIPEGCEAQLYELR